MCPTCVSERCEAEERDGRDLNTYDLRLSTDRPTYYSYIVPTYLPTSNTKVGSLDYYTFFITYFIVLLVVLLSITTSLLTTYERLCIVYLPRRLKLETWEKIDRLMIIIS